MTYVELHAHSAYSFLDGASQPEELAARAAELGYDALALTDHDGVYGSLEFAHAAKGDSSLPIQLQGQRFTNAPLALLFRGTEHIGKIIGWPVPEALAFIRDLTEHATQPQFVYSHKWRVGDMVMWDNRTVMHRATRFDDLKETRDLRRTSIKGTGLAVPRQMAAE